MKKLWNWNCLILIPPVCILVWLAHMLSRMVDAISLVVLAVFSFLFVGLTLVMWLRMPLNYTFDCRSVRIRYLLGVEEFLWDTVWKIEPVNYGQGGRWLMIHGTPVGKH